MLIGHKSILKWIKYSLFKNSFQVASFVSSYSNLHYIWFNREKNTC